MLARAGELTVMQATRPHQSPRLTSSLSQIATSFLPLIALVACMHASLEVSYWLTLGLAIPAAGMVVRIFIIQHDCGHRSFFRSNWANTMVGRLCSLVTLTPFGNWRRQHSGHHAMWNNLDHRESGADFYSTCLTVREYRALSGRERWKYRALRHPLVGFVLIPPLVFLALYRIPFDTPRSWRSERTSVYLTNVALVVYFAAQGLVLGFEAVAAVQLPITVGASCLGVWLFSVQHRFKGARWFRDAEWDPASAAIRGSSFLKLPRPLQWFTGNIGFHHLHHLNPRIPNYRLESCHRDLSRLVEVPPIGLGQALSAWRHVLWDEEQGRLVGISEPSA